MMTFVVVLDEQLQAKHFSSFVAYVSIKVLLIEGVLQYFCENEAVTKTLSFKGD